MFRITEIFLLTIPCNTLQGDTFKGMIMCMPCKNIVKVYVENGYYHIYNRGVEKRNIFLDECDFKTFLNILKTALIPPPEKKDLMVNFTTFKGDTFKGIARQTKNFHGEIELLAYCLMPNHFHLLIKQNTNNGIKKFMQSVTTRYSLYFNKKYKRVGALFQSAYKAALITEEPYLLHLTRYIHLNPAEYTKELINIYSSYGDYIGIRKTSWVNSDFILSFFGNKKESNLIFLESYKSYRDFVEKYKGNSTTFLEGVTLEN